MIIPQRLPHLDGQVPAGRPQSKPKIAAKRIGRLWSGRSRGSRSWVPPGYRWKDRSFPETGPLSRIFLAYAQRAPSPIAGHRDSAGCCSCAVYDAARISDQISRLRNAERFLGLFLTSPE